jgi:3-oxoacyl-[acyl-carrier-protein] synthase II
MDNKKVVVTGIGVVTPIGASKEAFWKNLAEGRSGIAGVSPEKKRAGVDVVAAVRAVLPEKYRHMERSQQFAVVAARSALADAGVDLRTCAGTTIGTVISSSKNNVAVCDYFRRVICREAGAFYYDPNAAVCGELGIRGPVSNAVSACSTGLHSIVLGVQMIRRGEADLAIAGATEASLTDFILSGFKNMGVLAQADGSAAGVFRPFDRDRRGFVIGEGAGVVVLESYGRAVARGARVYGEIGGWANASDPYHMTAFNPDGESIARAIRQALAAAGLDTVDYINCHGTATKKNDTIETCGIKKGIGNKAREVSLSSTKPITGHLLGAGGAVECIVALLAMERGFVPPTLNLDHADPACDLDYTPKTGVRRDVKSAMSLSFGFGGHIGVIVAKKTGN